MYSHYRQRYVSQFHRLWGKTLYLEINVSWLDTHDAHLLAEVAIHSLWFGIRIQPTFALVCVGYNFSRSSRWTNHPQPEGENKSSMSKIHLRDSIAKCTREIFQVDINPKKSAHPKLVLIHRNTRITAPDDEFHTILEKYLLSQHQCVIRAISTCNT